MPVSIEQGYCYIGAAIINNNEAGITGHLRDHRFQSFLEIAGPVPGANAYVKRVAHLLTILFIVL